MTLEFPTQAAGCRQMEALLPPFVDGEAFEFIELKNTGAVPLNVSGLNFTGITFTFPPDTTIAPGAFCVLVSNAAHFAARFPGCAASGTYAGQRLGLSTSATETSSRKSA